MTDRYQKLKRLLEDLFQLNRPELDFGIYRIMHARSDEISAFLDEDLLPQVRDAFEVYRSADRASLERELSDMKRSVERAGMDPAESPKVRELEEREASTAVDLEALEAEVYEHLYRFFRRYYSDGDFLSKRVYKPGVYAIPYEGEEVKLHWANSDQYYTKTGEYLRDYAFQLRPGEADPMRVHFRLVDAAEGEHDNVKESEDRVFVLAAGRDTPFVTEVEGEAGPELEIRFEYRPATMRDWPLEKREDERERLKNPKPPKQKDLDELAVEAILAMKKDTDLARWITELALPHVLSSGAAADYTRLEAHLCRYSARNAFDYFIHKDLGAFLRRELDFYIKNEVMHLDDIEDESLPRVEQYLSKIKVIRRIAGKLIEFLAQLEDFQKKLWLKKKFVVETSWCVALGSIPDDFYAEIAANDAQREEWVQLHAIDKLQGKQGDLTRPRYSVPLTTEFLSARPTLMLDTRHFDTDFTWRLLEAVGDLDELTGGVLVHGENFQALSLMATRFHDLVAIAYNDPPYNTGRDDFLFRDAYQHSSWLSMINDRAALCRHLLVDDGLFVSSIGDDELPRLRIVLSSVFGPSQFLANFVWNNQGNIDNQSRVKVNHEYLVAFSKDDASYSRPLVIAPEIGPDSKLYNDTIENSITKNGPANPPTEVLLPAGFPASFESGALPAQETDWPHRREPVEVANSVLTKPTRLFSGWSSRSLLDEFLANDCRPIVDARGLKTWFALTHTGAIYVYKERDQQSHVLSVIRGVSTVKKMSLQLAHMGFTFSYPKPVDLIEYVCKWTNRTSARILDCFAGSGTTGHAVINLNRQSGGMRKFILVEMGPYFDTVLLPRLKKVTFTPEWKDGKPQRLATPSEAEASPRVMKVLRLESYEDALNNLDTRRSQAQQDLLDDPATRGADGFREDYLLRYMLDVETRDSLLNLKAFSDPDAHLLRVKRPGSDETREVAVDLLETFNWLTGLSVERLEAPRTVRASTERNNEGRLRLVGNLEDDPAGKHRFRAVTGMLRDGRRALVIWRRLTGDPENDNLVLDEWFAARGFADADPPFDVVYVNGGNNLDGLRRAEDTWRVKLIEEDFHRLMFAESTP